MKILHTADLHLDSVMEANLDPSVATQRRKELLLTFGRMVDYAAKVGVRVFLICGDLFDTAHPSPDAEGYVMSQIAAHPEIDFLCLWGNHNEGYTPTHAPANLRTFPQKGYAHYRYGDVVITGSESNSSYHELRLEEKDINILALHGQLSDSITDLAVINLKFYRNLHIDYLALGHYHRQRKEPLDDRGVWAYCGTPEGRGFDEAGEKGFMLLDTDGGRLSSVFVPFAKRTVHLVTVDISRLFNQRDIEKVVGEAVAAIPQSDLVRVVLRGIYETEMHKDIEQLTSLFEDRFFHFSVVDESNISLRPDSYEHDVSLKGEFVRTVLACGLSREDTERIIRCGIQALNGEEVDE
ncbi:MAG: metallophosphoesterase [Clostridia bacterium]|nr:metallophosphoesterase [Clostridia bacterium]